MTPAPELDVKVVYIASSGRRGGAAGALTGRKSRASIWLLVGAFNCIAAAGFYYATWWKVDKFIYMKFVWNTPVPGVDLNAAAAGIFGIAAEAAPNDTASAAADETLESPPRFVGEVATRIIGVTAYSWLTLSTIACCLLALSSGTAWGRIIGPTGRSVGLILSIGGAVGLGWAAYEVWAEYGTHYPPGHLRAGMGGLVLLGGLIGLAIGRQVRGSIRLAATALILSAVGSVVALYLGAQCDAIDTTRASVGFLILVFVIHSSYGWVLFPVASRVAR